MSPARHRRLGQNFLADPNLLDAIVREAGVGGGDVVLEVGGGEGALSERLAPRVARLWVVELDERLRPSLEELAAAHASLRVVWGDAMRIDLAALDPLPTAVVANLPYSIATPLLLRTITELPAVHSWTVMVQREIAERLRARSGSRVYGAPSVIVQLSCEVWMLRTVDPAVFTPRPRVASALLRLQRRGEAPREAVRRLVRDAFAHRRKSLPRSVELAARAREAERWEEPGEPPRRRGGELRQLAQGALTEAGFPASARAEALSPADHLRVAESILAVS